MAGRKPTTKARREALMAEAQEAQIAPLDYMLSVLNAPKPARILGEKAADYSERLVRWEERRMDAAKAAAPYVHAKPIASVKIESVTDVEDHKPVNVLELAKQVAFLFTMAQVRPEVDITPNKLN